MATDWASAIPGLSPGSIIQFFEFNLDQTTVYRCYTGYDTSEVGGLIAWRGHTWQPVPFETEGFEWDGTGNLPEPTISIADKDNYLLQWGFSVGDIRGFPITRYKTLYEFLDSSTHSGAELWLVDWFEADGFMFRVHLAMPVAVKSVKLPRRVMYSDAFPALSRLKV